MATKMQSGDKFSFDKFVHYMIEECNKDFISTSISDECHSQEGTFERLESGIPKDIISQPQLMAHEDASFFADSHYCTLPDHAPYDVAGKHTAVRKVVQSDEETQTLCEEFRVAFKHQESPCKFVTKCDCPYLCAPPNSKPIYANVCSLPKKAPAIRPRSSHRGNPKFSAFTNFELQNLCQDFWTQNSLLQERMTILNQKIVDLERSKTDLTHQNQRLVGVIIGGKLSSKKIAKKKK